MLNSLKWRTLKAFSQAYSSVKSLLLIRWSQVNPKQHYSSKREALKLMWQMCIKHSKLSLFCNRHRKGNYSRQEICKRKRVWEKIANFTKWMAHTLPQFLTKICLRGLKMLRRTRISSMKSAWPPQTCNCIKTRTLHLTIRIRNQIREKERGKKARKTKMFKLKSIKIRKQQICCPILASCASTKSSSRPLRVKYAKLVTFKVQGQLASKCLNKSRKREAGILSMWKVIRRWLWASLAKNSKISCAW